MRKRLDVIGSLLTLLGFCALLCGLWMLFPALSVCVGGIGAMVGGLLICRYAGGVTDDR